MPTFTASVMAPTADVAAAKVERHLAKCPGFELTGRVMHRSERHQLWHVEIDGDGDVNDCWVVLTSYGISPGVELGSTWQTVPGVGAGPDGICWEHQAGETPIRLSHTILCF